MVQQLRKSITALVFFLISGVLGAQPAKPPSTPLALKEDAPDRYVVVPGDTLWGISGRYTDSPWRWPELWGLNREQIQNPHLIYPGYVILLDRARGRLTIGAPGAPGAPGSAGPDTTAGRTPGSGSTPSTSTIPSAPGVVRLSPRARGEGLAKDMIPSIPAGAIEPFISRPLVVEPDGLDKAPTIVATQTDRGTEVTQATRIPDIQRTEQHRVCDVEDFAACSVARSRSPSST